MEKEKLKGRLREMEMKVESLERGRTESEGVNSGEGGVLEGRGGEGPRNLMGKVNAIEWRLERREREEKRGNIVMKGIKEGKEGLRVEVCKLLKEIGVVGTVEEVRRIGARRKDGTNMAVVKLGNLAMKRDVMEKKMLKGREERIEEDLTWRERKMMWRLGEMVRKEEGEGRRAWVRYGRIWIGGKWWKWDEYEEVLKEERGEKRFEERERGGGEAEMDVKIQRRLIEGEGMGGLLGDGRS